MVRSAGLLADVPFASLELPGPLAAIGAGLALLALLAALRRVRSRGAQVDADDASWPTQRPEAHRSGQRTRRLAAGGIGAVLVVSLWLAVASGPAAPLRISVLDVGQGDAILVEAADGSRLLVDGGADPDLLVRRLDERIPIWDRRIDLVVLTHPHEDHAGGLAGLVPRYRVGRIAETGVTGDGAGVRELRLVAERLGIGRLGLSQGDAFRLGAARVDVLWPPRADVGSHGPDDEPGGQRHLARAPHRRGIAARAADG